MEASTRHSTTTRDGRALLNAVETIVDMGQRVQANGPEATYVSEKLGQALFKAAEALALCGIDLEPVLDEARRGHERGLWLRRGAP